MTTEGDDGEASQQPQTGSTTLNRAARRREEAAAKKSTDGRAKVGEISRIRQEPSKPAHSGQYSSQKCVWIRVTFAARGG